MAAPFRSHRHFTNPDESADRPWRCGKCFKLLGHRSEHRVEIRFARGHQYVVSLPVTAVCRCCGRLNELR